MDKNDLRSMWHETSAVDKEKYNLSLSDIAVTKHGDIITKVLTEQKQKVILYSFFFVVYLGLMVYAFVYLRLKLSVLAVIPLVVAGVFIFCNTIIEATRLSLLTHTSANMSIKESTLCFGKKLKRIGIIDFITYLLFFYLSAAGTIVIYLNDIGGINNLSQENEMKPFILVLVPMLLLLPWFLRYQHNQRYKKLYANLKNSIRFLEED
jgi:hypothetical protein